MSPRARGGSRPRHRFLRLLAVLVMGLVASAGALSAVAQDSARGGGNGGGAGPTVEWEYVLAVEDAAEGLMRVTLTFHGAEGVVDRFGFRTADHPYSLAGFEAHSGTLTRTADGVELRVDTPTPSFSYVVNVNRESPRAGEDTSHLNAGWGVVKADAFALPFNYTYYERSPPTWRAIVRAELPAGWNLVTPWTREGDGFALAPGTALPRGFLAIGPFYTDRATIEGREIRYARIGDPLSFETAVFRYIAGATPYYRAVYGDFEAPAVLIVVAPAPMFSGGLADGDTIFLATRTDLRTLAHEYAHVWQRFSVVTRAGESAIWLNEGDADLRGTLSLVATGDWSMKQANDWLRSVHADRGNGDTRMPDVTYGHEDERTAYRKGIFIAQALDVTMRQATGDALGFSDLLRELNHRFEHAEGERPKPMTNGEVLDAINRLTGWDVAPFFHRFVYGSEWPAFRELEAKPDLVVMAIRTTPERPREGMDVHVEVDVLNRGISAGGRDVSLRLAGAVVGTIPVQLGIGDARTLLYSLKAPSPGEHDLAALNARGVLHVVTPGDLTLPRVTVLPLTPRAGEAVEILVHVVNEGEDEGRGQLNLRVDGAERASRSVTIPGLSARTYAFQMDPVADPRTLLVEVVLTQLEKTLRTEVPVRLDHPDRDRDGVPDHLDAYPEDPRHSERSLVASVETFTGLPATFVALGSGLAVVVVGFAVTSAVRAKRVQPDLPMEPPEEPAPPPEPR